MPVLIRYGGWGEEWGNGDKRHHGDEWLSGEAGSKVHQTPAEGFCERFGLLNAKQTALLSPHTFPSSSCVCLKSTRVKLKHFKFHPTDLRPPLILITLDVTFSTTQMVTVIRVVDCKHR